MFLQRENLKNEKIAILGLSVEGLSTGNYLRAHNIPFTVLEKKELSQLGKKAEILGKWNMPFVLGKDHLARLNEFTLIFRAPGIPLDLPELSRAKQSGIKITSHTKFFMEFCPATVIGVTGTKGKGTTSMLIKAILQESGKRVYLGGNIGFPPLDFLDELKTTDNVILELSSFQLEDFEKSPHIGVILGIAPDHLAPESPDAPNYHKSFNEYVRAKATMVQFQSENDFLVVNADDAASLGIAKSSKAKKHYFSKTHMLELGAFVENKIILYTDGNTIEKIGNAEKLPLKGEHNWYNVCAAITVGKILGCNTTAVMSAVFAFSGYEHRLEFVREVSGIKFYNDSAATNPEPSIAAIHAFSEPVILVAGGSDKGQQYDELGGIIAQSHVKAVYLIGDMAERINNGIKKSGTYTGTIIMAGKPDMKKIVEDCYDISRPGDVILLSPACASFDMFLNYKDRGLQFKEAVMALREKT